ncbi:LTA synthase family protein [Pontibacter diazotrophicus]|uniref:LTA synthase family protein n=1 Tax=Pontibacter diazotrophicus TaxID=1400979 RepID=A0A3D8LGJ2_9BACT|nr:LTA synthase family protein [Pontibacter diazotrophicus]RDV16344.1 LTA synthase family protein [Pontibacter diazotrophicus]
MKKPFIYQPLYFFFWVLYFIVARALFLLYHTKRSSELTTPEILDTFIFGLRLDFSFTAYVCAIPFFSLLVFALWPRLRVQGFIHVYTFTLLVLLSLLLAADLELYTYWGFRLDATPLQYLNTPGEMAASAAAAPLFLLLLFIMILSSASVIVYRLFFDLKKFNSPQNKRKYSILSLLYLALLVLPMRGGVQQIPINQSVAYFSSKPYANHAGLNMPWNLMHDLIKYRKTSKNPYKYMSPEEAAQRVQLLYGATTFTSTVQQYIAATKPNVLLIILESYTAKFVESLGGEQGVTPNLDRIAAEGISFTNIYASGDRSEKGMVALLSGYPVQTTTSIIKTPKKTAKLPQLSKVFKQQHYSTSYYYGGELEFANIKSYLMNGAYDRLIAKDDFPASSYNSKWGAHDHVLFERVLHDLKQEHNPFFTTVYTLSSHEPFEIPIEPVFNGDDEEAEFRNSVYYTDQALGKFIKQAKQEPWWQNTIVVITADHGHIMPGNDPPYAASKYHIPFVLTGGAITEKGVKVMTIGSQTDIAATLLAKLNLAHQDFTWSRDLLKPNPDPFAFYVFKDGFGYVTPRGILTFDNNAQQLITSDTGVTEDQLRTGKAYMQYSFEDFVRK